jgi:hypothetical protein
MCILFHLFPFFRFVGVQIFLFFFSRERIGVLLDSIPTTFFSPGLIKTGRFDCLDWHLGQSNSKIELYLLEYMCSFPWRQNSA